MSEFAQAALQLNPQAEQDWLRAINERGRQRWQAKPFPTRKTEDWKYTSLRGLAEGDYLRWPQPVDEQSLAVSIDIAGLDACRLVFVNGIFSAALSATQFPQGVEAVRFAAANGEQQQRITAGLASVADSERHPFAALNESWLRDGLYLRIAANARVTQPLQIVHVTTAQAQRFAVQQRLLVDVERGAEATLLEHFTSSDEAQNCFTNGITEIRLHDNARLTHYRLHLEEESALHIGGVHVDLSRDAALNSFQIALGTNLLRVDVSVSHSGKGAHCQLNGIYLPHNRQLVDFHTNVEHKAPNCTTREIFRGIIGDRARAVFNGRIHIHPDAQKSAAELSNKNLLTSADAEVDTKPELEIYADDVKCSHGATVAQLDEKSVYYLRSRGIDHDEAVMMLSFGFIHELLQEVQHAPLREFLSPVLERAFAEEFHLEKKLA